MGVANALEQLRAELRRWRFSSELRLAELASGDPSGFLPLLHFLFLKASPHLSKHLVANGYELAAKSDVRFLEVVYRLCRAELGYNPVLNTKQFLTTGFAERKLQMVTDLSVRCRSKHGDLTRTQAMGRKVGASLAAYQAGSADALATPRRSLDSHPVAAPSHPRWMASPAEKPRCYVPHPTCSVAPAARRLDSASAPLSRSMQAPLAQPTVVCELPRASDDHPGLFDNFSPRPLVSHPPRGAAPSVVDACKTPKAWDAERACLSVEKGHQQSSREERSVRSPLAGHGFFLTELATVEHEDEAMCDVQQDSTVAAAEQHVVGYDSAPAIATGISSLFPPSSEAPALGPSNNERMYNKKDNEVSRFHTPCVRTSPSQSSMVCL